MKKIILYAVAYLLIILFSGILMSARVGEFDKSAYYKVMESGKVDAIEQQIKILETVPELNKQAYTGALLMKKAGLVKGASKKLNIFKNGHKQLEAAIEKEKDNAEFRFLRLIIQEHAPKILGYKKDIDKDAAIIHTKFASLSPEVKTAILSYQKQSGALQKLKF